MQIISMKSDPAEDKNGNATALCADECEKPLYPWGLELRLEDESLTKLGVDASSLSIGQKFTVTAYVEVTSTSLRKEQDGTDACVSLQITDMALDARGDSPVQGLYAKSNMNP
jgi:hypothetical protein